MAVRFIQHQARPTYPFKAAGAPISGMAFVSQFVDPLFPKKVESHFQPAGPNLPLLTSTLPTGISGVAWRNQFVDPLFSTTVKSYLQPDNATIKVAPTLPPAGNEGMPFVFPLSEPRFENKFKVELQQTNMHALEDPDNFAPPTTTAWWRYPFDQPQQIKVPTYQQQTEFRNFSTSVLPAGISGIAWSRVWETPRFPGRPLIEAHTTNVLIPSTVPVGISGTAWWYAWDRPQQRKYLSFLQQAEGEFKILPETRPIAWYQSFPGGIFTRIPVERQEGTDEWLPIIPATNPVPISGIAWAVPFSQPKQVKVDINQIQTEMKGVLISSTLPRPAYLVGRRLPLLTPPIGNFLANLWKGQTDGC